MASENDFRQLRFSDDRGKLDSFRLFDTESPEDIKNATSLCEESDHKRLQPEPKYNVRKSLAWDSAFFTSPGVLELEELFGAINSQFMDKSIDIFGNEEEILFCSGSLEPNVKSRVDKCDLRKSLAWDNAFFTNAGVLDPEELSIVNRGFKNSGTHLPGIEEDVSRSIESNFSVDSGSSSLNSLEIDLFEDIRESSHKLTNKLSASAPSLKFQSVKGSNKVNASSGTRVKGMLTSRRQNINPQGAERCKKKASLSAPSLKQISSGSGELNLLSSLKPPKLSDRIKNAPMGLAKRAPFSASLVKVGSTKFASGQCLTIPRKPSLGNLNSISYCSTPSPKSSTVGFPLAAHESVSCCRNNSGSKFKTPLSYTIGKKTELGSSCNSSYVFTPTSSSCPSPDSSVDGWSSESSSTTAVEKSNNPKPKAYLTSSSLQVSLENIASKVSALRQSCTENGSEGRRLLKCHNKKTPLGTSSLASTLSKNAKPSGLRMPSTKIGYFDEENSSIATTDGGTQFHSGTQSASSKVGRGISVLNRPVNQAKYVNPMISRTTSGTPKQNGPESALQITPKNPKKVNKAQNASPNEPTTRSSIQICFPMTFKVEKDLPQETTCDDYSETEMVDRKGQYAAVEDTQSSSMVEIVYNEGSMENKFGTKHKEIILGKANKKTLNEYEEHMNCAGENLRIRDDSDKENIYNFEEQVEGLSKYVGTIELGEDMVIELKVSKTTSKVQSTVLRLKI